MDTLSALLDGLAERQEEVLRVLLLGSIVMLLVSVLALPWIVRRMPADYYAATAPKPRLAMLPAPLRLPLLVLKNALGVLVLLAGVAMLVLPGQGLLTCMLALALLDFPGKRRFERWLVARPAMIASLNWLRRRLGRPPFRLDEGNTST